MKEKEAASEGREVPTFNLTLYLSITTFVAVVLLSLCLLFLFGRQLNEIMTTLSSRYAVYIAEGIGAQIFRDFTLPLKLKGEKVDLHDPEQLELLHRVVQRNLSGFAIKYVKIYDEKGRVLYSTRFEDVGKVEEDNPWLQQALQGHVVSHLVKFPVQLPSGKEITVEAIETYVPVGLRPGGAGERFKGVFRIRQDITPLQRFFLRARAAVVGSTLGFMALFFAILLIIARNADNIIRRQTEALRQKNRELEALEKLKRDLTNMIVHDMKNPLTALMGNIDLVLEGIGGEVQPKQRQFLERARSSGRRLLAMIGNLLDISKLEEGKLELKRVPFALREVVDEVVAETMPLVVEEEKELAVELPDDLPPLNADREMIRRVVANLVSNALKHTYRGGHIWIRGQVRDSEVWVSVQDDGEGIPPEYHQKIFEKFTQVEDRKLGYKTDTGLGLAFCKMAVEAHGGRIWVESEPGKGSTFTFTVPLSGKEPGSPGSRGV